MGFANCHLDLADTLGSRSDRTIGFLFQNEGIPLPLSKPTQSLLRFFS